MSRPLPPDPNRFEVIPGHGLYGALFGTFGFVKEDIRPDIAPQLRALVGVVQRFYTHDIGEYKYDAVELSIPIPKGISGAPLFLHDRPSYVFAVATGTSGTTIVEDEKNNNGRTVSYGSDASLIAVEEWTASILST